MFPPHELMISELAGISRAPEPGVSEQGHSQTPIRRCPVPAYGFSEIPGGGHQTGIRPFVTPQSVTLRQHVTVSLWWELYHSPQLLVTGNTSIIALEASI